MGLEVTWPNSQQHVRHHPVSSSYIARYILDMSFLEYSLYNSSQVGRLQHDVEALFSISNIFLPHE